MKRILIGVIAILCLLVQSKPSLSNDPWNDYEKFLQQFYFLSEQSFEQIECQVVLPEVEQMLNQQSQQLKEASKGAAEIISNLNNFRMTYSKSKGLSFNEPSVEIKVTSEDFIKDRQKFETGKQAIINGYNQTIKGTIQTIQGVFDDYIEPDKNRISLSSFNLSGERAEYKYKQESMDVTRVCEKNHCTSSSKNAQMDVESDENYDKVGDKLAIQSASATMKQPGTEIHLKTNIKYQQVRDLFFPSSISSDLQMQTSMAKTEGKFDIQFKDVKVK